MQVFGKSATQAKVDINSLANFSANSYQENS
jgi:hypothetical protein